MTDREIVAKIKAYMQRHNLRQWQFAKKINVPERTVSRWLNGHTKISGAYLRVLKEEGII